MVMIPYVLSSAILKVHEMETDGADERSIGEVVINRK